MRFIPLCVYNTRAKFDRARNGLYKGRTLGYNVVYDRETGQNAKMSTTLQKLHSANYRYYKAKMLRNLYTPGNPQLLRDLDIMRAGNLEFASQNRWHSRCNPLRGMNATHTNNGVSMMKIGNVNGTFWNEDNNCWTVAESAATEYDSLWDAPAVIDGLSLDHEYEGFYADGDTDPTATMVE